MKKTIIYFFLLLQFSHPLFAPPGEDLFFEKLDVFNSRRYNSLPDAEEADLSLSKKENFPSFFEEAVKLAQEYNFDDFLGLRLLHNHTQLADDSTIMVEHTQKVEGLTSFITKPFILKGENTADLTPASWIPAENGYTVFEYSSDAETRDYYTKLKQQPSFFSKFYNLLNKYKLQSLISPAIVTKEKLLGSTTVGLVEHTYNEPFESVVTYKELSNYKEKSLVTTSWPFVFYKKETKCFPRCYAGTSCERRASGHVRNWKHNITHVRGR